MSTLINRIRPARFLPQLRRMVSPAVQSMMERIKVDSLPKTPAVKVTCQICYKECLKGARCDQCGNPRPSHA